MFFYSHNTNVPTEESMIMIYITFIWINISLVAILFSEIKKRLIMSVSSKNSKFLSLRELHLTPHFIYLVDQPSF